jgi:hypothetical protein
VPDVVTLICCKPVMEVMLELARSIVRLIFHAEIVGEQNVADARTFGSYVKNQKTTLRNHSGVVASSSHCGMKASI